MNREEARKRAKQLVDQMTLEECAGQLKYDAPAVKRLGIPAYNWWNESLHGVARAGCATVFPQAIGMAASFDEELLQEVAEAIAEEARAKYNAYSSVEERSIYKGLTFWAPNINIFRDPRWGRGHETYGEDPYLIGRLGTAYVKGLQGDGEYLKAAACAKHFAVHSGPEGLRHEFDAQASAKDMEETYLPAFEDLVKEAGVEAVMGAYNRTNGEPCCGSPTLIQELLREKWGFEGHFVSDCWAIRDFHEHHGVTDTPEESAAMAINAGCDVNCGNTYLHILKAYEQGLVEEKTIRQAAVRLFTTRYLLGLFDKTEYDEIGYDRVECREHLELAERAAQESIVLLKNNGILPLEKEKIHTIGVIGPNADSRRALMGNYYGTASEYITMLEGIRRVAGDSVKVLYAQGSSLGEGKEGNQARRRNLAAEAKIVAAHSDVVVLCLGLDETMEGEQGDTGNSDASGDKLTLQLPLIQRELMETVQQCGKPVILCMLAGSDLDMSYPREHFDGILQVWYPGARGGLALAKILFGEVSPSGKLPVTFYEDINQLPEITDYSMKGRTYRYMTEPAQYPFGFGLTYGDVTVEEAEIGWEAGQAFVTAKVKNGGNVATGDVIQVYLGWEESLSGAGANVEPESAGEVGVEEDNRNPALCGMKRVFLQPGETRSIRIKLGARTFTKVDEEGNRTPAEGNARLYVGNSQPDEKSAALLGHRPVVIDTHIFRV